MSELSAQRRPAAPGFSPIPANLAGPVGSKTGHFQAVPFHRKIRVLEGVAGVPTAQALLAEVAATPERPALGAGLGLGTCFHAVPFQRRITVLKAVAPPV